MLFSLLSVAPVAVWLYLLTARAGYWRTRKHLLPPADGTVPRRRIVAVVPARNEADVVADSLQSLLAQALPIPMQVVLVNDGSEDGTGDVARAAADRLNRREQLTVLEGKPLPAGWTGKLWAVAQGIKQAESFHPDYFLLTDADIHHASGSIGSLLLLAETGGFDLSSVMVRLATETKAERLLIPAFVYFFLQLYPPAWTSDRMARTAGAAGGCMLIRADALQAIGGIQAIAGKVIDDCALAAAVKRHKRSVWMGLSIESTSLRSYGGFAGVGKMISRSAFSQLNHSAVLLALTLAGLFITYVYPVALLFSKKRYKRLAGVSACTLMSISYGPVVRLYRRPALAMLSLPLIALFYADATIHSALRYWAGAGGEWKGRMQDRRNN